MPAKLGKRYRLEFEVLSSFSDTWIRTFRESDSLEELKGQQKGQIGMHGVKNSILLEQTVSEWSPVAD